MALSLSHLQAAPYRTAKRVGRGPGSGKGTYAGRGNKGQRARSGGRSGLQRRGVKQFLQQIPKLRGFRSPHLLYATVNVMDLNRVFADGSVVTPERMHKVDLTKTNKLIKILGAGKLEKKLTVRAHAFSETARAAIIAAGGTATLIILKKSIPYKQEAKRKAAAKA